MHRALIGLRPTDVTGLVEGYGRQLERIRLSREACLADLDDAMRQMTDAVLALEADVARELAAVRDLLGELAAVDPHVRRRLDEVQAQLQEAEQAQWTALAALEERVVEERDLSRAVSREVLAVAERTRAALADARARTVSWPSSARVQPAPAPQPPRGTSVAVALGQSLPAAELIPAATSVQPPPGAAADAGSVAAFWLTQDGQVGM